MKYFFVSVLCGLFAVVRMQNSTTIAINANVTDLIKRNDTTLISNNGTKTVVAKRKTFLIINYFPDALRSKKKRTVDKKKNKVTSLLYVERDEDGNKVSEYFMYDLKDVKDFLQIYFDENLTVCYEMCYLEQKTTTPCSTKK